MGQFIGSGRVRSITETSMMLAMPMPPTTREIRAPITVSLGLNISSRTFEPKNATGRAAYKSP